MSIPTTITTDLSLPEAPVLLADGSWLVAEMDLERGTVVRITPEGVREPIAKTGRPNGLALAHDGAVWVAESLEPALLRLELSGEFRRELEQVDGLPLIWPNDLCFGPDGALYVTDSGIPVGDYMDGGNRIDGAENLPMNGTVFRFDPSSRAAWLIDEGLRFANGIAFGPDGLLYANESLTGNLWRYRLEDGRPAGERELFGSVNDPSDTESGARAPDGMAFSADGRLWVAVWGQGEVTVLDHDGEVEQRIPLAGQSPTNVAFGPAGDTRIYVVEDEKGSLASLEVGVGGLPLHD